MTRGEASDVVALDDEWVFPCGAAGRNRPLSEAAVLSALRRMGFTRDQTVAHSFRSTASTILNESGLWTPDAIEMQLAHAQKDRIRGIYNRAQSLEERRKMMQWYADKLDGLRLGQRISAPCARSAPHPPGRC